jgi:hypothetical protein
MAKGFTQRECIDYTKIFSPVSCKNSLRIIMTLVTYYDLELHQIDVKMTFLNRDLLENVYMEQLKCFAMKGKEHMGCHMRKSIYELKQDSRQWYLKFDETIRSFGFKENEEDNCIYAKFRRGKFIFLILYVDDILLASSDASLLLETKRFLSSNFDMKYLGEASFVLGIEIHRDRRNGVLGLSQKSYLKNILKKFSMHACNPMPAPIVKGDKYVSFQSPKNQYEIDQMKSVLYASALESLMYAQVCTHSDLAFVTGMLARYQKNPGISHWNGIKKALRYIQGTKGLMLTYERSDILEIVGYSDSDFVGCLDTDRFTSGYVFKLAGGAISWSSSKQTVMTSSTIYAEFIACYEAMGQAMWLKKFVLGLRVVDSIERPLKLYCDNEPAVLYAHNNKKTKATKHINISFYVVKEKIQDQTISLEHISTKKMIADPLTNGLPPSVLR